MTRMIDTSYISLSRRAISVTLGLICLCQTLPALALEATPVRWEQLNLSEEQREHMQEMDAQWHESVQQVAPRIETRQRRLKMMMNAPSANEAEVMQLQQQVHQDKMRLKMKATQIFLNKKKVLTPEQQQKLNRMMQPE